jgi:beta-xylosidase
MCKIQLLLVFLILFLSPNSAQKYPSTKNHNPLFAGEWYADPEIAVVDKTFWIFPTVSTTYEKGIYFDAFSSSDLVNWEKHPRIIDTTTIKWLRKALWAPAFVQHNGKCFLFFGANDIQTPESKWWRPENAKQSQYGGIGICVADQPAGPYTDYLGKPLIDKVYNGAQPIDQFVFKDKDGQYYLIYGGWKHCNIAKLANDFKSIIPFENGELLKEITPEGYVEGPVMFIRNNKYYLMWSEGDWAKSSYRVAYSWSDTPIGPFKRIGTVLEQDSAIATGAGHHSMLQIPDTDSWYIVYHRRPIPNKGTNHRVVCIDRIYFDADGKIRPVKMTLKGVNKRTLN